MKLHGSTKVAILCSLLIHATLLIALRLIDFPFPASVARRESFVYIESRAARQPKSQQQKSKARSLQSPSLGLSPVKQEKPEAQEKRPTKLPEERTPQVSDSSTVTTASRPIRALSDLTFAEIDSLGRLRPDLKEALARAWFFEGALKQDSVQWKQQQRFAAMFANIIGPGPLTVRDRNRHPLYGTPYDPMRAHYSQNQIDLIGVLKFLNDLFR